MKNKLLINCLFLFSIISYSQQKITWKNLAEVTFTEKEFPNQEGLFLYPTFSNTLKNLKGKKVSIKGYFLDVHPEEKIYILSKGPMSACFFCGTGGPETAVEIQFTATQNFNTDDIVIATGTLQLNKDDINHFNYILKNCTVKTVN